MLSARQIAQYRETGYLAVEGVLDASLVSQAKQIIAEFVGGAGKITKHDSVYDLEPTHRPEAPRVRRIKTPHSNHPFFWELAKLPKLVAMLEQLLGPSGVRLHGSKINLKAPHYGSPVEWHQDWAFYPHTNDDLLAVGVMLDDMLLENGPLMVMPGTHRGPTWDHHLDGAFAGAINPDACDLDFAKAVPLTAPAGSISIHHVRMVHGSAQNASQRPRQLLLYEYAAADAWPLMGVADLKNFRERQISGPESIVPRIVPAPVRMPLPPAPHQGSIYENQTSVKSRYFKVTEPV
jgi:ectoine hydroxylase-related dioxygenase (phytanoyl-CoA dioxygenase family)